MQSKYPIVPGRIVDAALAGAAFLGALLLVVGWYFNSQALVGPYGPFADLRFDAAIGIFLLALANVMPQRWKIIALPLVAVVAVSALLTILADAFRFSQPTFPLLDYAFLVPAGRSGDLHLPFATSLALLLLCVAMTIRQLATATALQNAFSLAGAGVAVLVMIQGLASSTALVIGHDFGGTHEVSLQGAVMITLLAAGIALRAWRALRPCGFLRLDHYYAWSVLALSAVFLLAWDYQEGADWNQRAFETEVALSTVSSEVLEQLDQLGLAQQRMASRWSIYGPPSQMQWEADAKDTLMSAPALFSISYVGTDRVAHWRVARSGNQKDYTGIRLDGDPVRKMAFDAVDRLKAMQMTRTVVLPDDKSVRLFLTPLFSRTTTTGYLLAALHLQDLPVLIPADVTADFNVEIRDHSTYAPMRTGDDSGVRVSKSTHIETFGQYWTVIAWPKNSYILARRSLLLWPTLVFGSFITFLVGASLSQTRKNHITLRRETEATHELVTTLEHIRDGFVTMDRNWRVTYANDQAAVITEMRKDELIGRPMLDPSSPTELPEKVAALTMAMSGEGAGHFVEQYKSSGRWLDATAYPTADGVAMFFRDFTEARAIEQHLRLLESAVSRQNDVLLITEAKLDDSGDTPRIVYVNDAFTRLTGYGPQEAIGRSPRILQGPNTSRATLDLVRDAVASRQPIQVELVNYAKDGTEFIIEMDIAPITDRNGNCTHFVAVERDITERKRIQSQAIYNQERFEHIVDVTNDIIWDADLATTNVQYNENLKLILGYDPALTQLTTADWESWIHPDDLARVIKVIQDSVLTAGPPVDMEYRIRKADGTWAIMLDRAKVIRDTEGKPTRIVGTMADITERRAMAERLRQSQQLEAVGQLTGGVAHDFNNLLTVILGNSELLADRLEDQPKLQKLAEMTVAMALRGAELTNRLLAFARRQPLEPKRIDVTMLVESMKDWMGRMLPENVSIQVRSSPDLWLISADPHQLENALLNLAVNGRDAMPSGGQLSVESTNVEVTEDFMPCLPEAVPGSYVRITVQDSGTGMDEDTLARAFEPFFTTKAMGKGSGLGLSMVYGFVRQSAGFAVINSTPGKGTAVHLYFPRLREDQDAPKHVSDPDSIVGGVEHILAVEDDESVLASTVIKLESLGYRVSSAAAGSAALDMIRQDPSIELLFTDIVMPGDLSGPELVDRAVVIRPDLKVLYTSGYIDDTISHDGKLDLGVTLLSKPYRLAELAGKVRSVLDR